MIREAKFFFFKEKKEEFGKRKNDVDANLASTAFKKSIQKT